MQTRLHTDYSRLIVTTFLVAVLRFLMFGCSLLSPPAIFATFFIPHPTLYSYCTQPEVLYVLYRYKETVFCSLTQRIRSATAFSEKHLQTDDKDETHLTIEK